MYRPMSVGRFQRHLGLVSNRVICLPVRCDAALILSVSEKSKAVRNDFESRSAMESI
jgi:hypothetical protein